MQEQGIQRLRDENGADGQHVRNALSVGDQQKHGERQLCPWRRTAPSQTTVLSHRLITTALPGDIKNRHFGYAGSMPLYYSTYVIRKRGKAQRVACPACVNASVHCLLI